MSNIFGQVWQTYGGKSQNGESDWRVLVNQTLLKLDAIVSLSVKNHSQITQPSTPSLGDRYIVGSGGWGINKQNYIAVYNYNENGTPSWVYYEPINGLRAYDTGDSTTYVYDSTTTSWVAMPSIAGSFEIPNVGEFSGSYVTGQSGNFLIDSFDKTIYGACEYLIYVKRASTSFKQVSKFIVTHDDATTTQLVDYAKIYSDQSAPLATFSSDIVGNNVRLIGTALYANLTVRVMKILVNI